MVDHAAIADAELHTPKGADSAVKHDLLYATGSSTTETSQFLEFCGTGYTSTGIYDYSTDGALTGGGYLQFDNLGDYSYLEISATNLILSTVGNISLQLGSSGSWQTGSNYQLDYFQKSFIVDNMATNASTQFAGVVYGATSGGTSVSRIKLYNFNASLPTILMVNRTGYINASSYSHLDGVGVHNLSTPMTRIRFGIPYANTSGIVTVRGIKG